MRRFVIIVVVLVLLVGSGLGYYYYRTTLQSKNQVLTNAPVGQRGLSSNVNIKADATSDYPTIHVVITDKTLLSTYLNQFDFWNRDLPYYNSVNKQVITKVRPESLILNLAQNRNTTYPFKVGDLGSFNDFYDLQDQPGPLIINIFIDPNQVASLSEEDLAKRFSTIGLSAIQFLAQNADPVSVIQLVEPPAPFVTFTRVDLTSPTPEVLPNDYPQDQEPPNTLPENPNNNAPLE